MGVFILLAKPVCCHSQDATDVYRITFYFTPFFRSSIFNMSLVAQKIGQPLPTSSILNKLIIKPCWIIVAPPGFSGSGMPNCRLLNDVRFFFKEETSRKLTSRAHSWVLPFWAASCSGVKSQRSVAFTSVLCFIRRDAISTCLNNTKFTTS